jgi:hypothetical protein
LASLIDVEQDVKSAILAPTVDSEVAVEGENPTATSLAREVNQASVSQVHWDIRVLREQTCNVGRSRGECERNRENPLLNVLQNCFLGPSESAEQLTAFGNYGFARHHRLGERIRDLKAMRVVLI